MFGIGRPVLAAVVWVVLGLSVSTSAQAEKRVALVIGNDTYKDLPVLQKARADAKAYADLLRDQGFDQVMLKTDLTKGGMDEAIATFLDAIKPGDTALFAYSGHGWSDGAQNYIVGTDAPKAGSQEFLARISVPLRNGSTGVLDDMDRRGAALKVAIIDACRDNPFQPQVGGKSIGVGRGLTRVDPPRGTFVVFSAGTGQTALDRLSDSDPDPNSIFTRAFVPLLRAGLPLQEATQKARTQVVALAGSVKHDQQPAYYDELLGEACLSGHCAGGAAPVLPPPGDPRVAEAALVWPGVQASTSIDVLKAFQAKYSGTVYADFAAARIGELQKLALLPPNPAPSPTPNPVPSPQQSACAGGVMAYVGSGGVATAARQCLKPKEAFRDCADVCPEMVVIPAGSFTMGSPAGETDRVDDEGPTHSVTIPAAFAVGKLAVTRGQFATFVKETGFNVGASCIVLNAAGDQWTNTAGKSYRDPAFNQDDNHPAVCVSWDDAKAYVAWLTKKTGKSYRLLTEAEYEYADRAGTTTPYWFGSDGNKLCGYANGADATAKTQFSGWTRAATCKDGYVYTAPGGSFAANGFGLFDMAGNAWSWTEDCFHDSYNGAPKDGASWTTGLCTERVLRGGSWIDNPRFLRSAIRTNYAPGNRDSYFGFRVARTLTP